VPNAAREIILVIKYDRTLDWHVLVLLDDQHGFQNVYFVKTCNNSELYEDFYVIGSY
jgi:hypothetical protein